MRNYGVCPTCGTRIEKIKNKFWCPSCKANIKDFWCSSKIITGPEYGFETKCYFCHAKSYNKLAQVCFSCGFSMKGRKPYESKRHEFEEETETDGEIIKMKARDIDTRIKEGFRLISDNPYDYEEFE